MRIDFLNIMKPQLFKAGDYITTYNQDKQSMFILADGVIQLFQVQLQTEIQRYLTLQKNLLQGLLNEKQIKEAKSNLIMKDKDISLINRIGEVFGDHSQITELQQKRGYTLCLTDVKVFAINNEDLKNFIQKMYTAPEFIEKYKFIGEAIPYLDKISRTTRDRVTKCFKYEKYPPGHVIFQEGDFLKQGYILKSGEVELFSNKNFKFIQLLQDLEVEDHLNEIQIFQQILLNSFKDHRRNSMLEMHFKKDSNNFVLQVKNQGQWIGEEAQQIYIGRCFLNANILNIDTKDTQS
eukprot:403332547